MATGKQITKHLFREVVKKVPSDRLGVMLIPTKAGTLNDHLVAVGEPLPQSYHRLVKLERDAIAELQAFFAELGVATVDATPFVARGVDADEMLFLRYSDGHPTGLGYGLMAEAAESLLGAR